ncbi:MAG: hypothetical protein II970_01090 [Paludibacteraceae bacterium]|nr:hypothetical protein [Paludibacteraceae bacterium]
MEDNSQHQRRYNYIYSKLVSDETDIIGHIAYALYKSDKVCFMEKLRAEGKEPTEEDLQQFHQISCLDSTLERYQMHASVIMEAFLNEVLKKHKADIEKNYFEEHDKRLREIVKPLKPNFWHGVWQSMVGAFFFAIILAAFAFVYTFSRNDTSIQTGIEAANVTQQNFSSVENDSTMLKH